MFKHDQFNSNFHTISGFPFTKTTLPVKIIQLRRVSQENHIQRIKHAYRKREIEKPIDNDLYFSFPKRIVSDLKASTTEPAMVQTCVPNMLSNRRDRSDLLPAKTNSESINHCIKYSRRNNSEVKRLPSTKTQKAFFRKKNNTMSRLYEGGDCNSHKLNKIKKEQNNSCSIQIRRETKTPVSAVPPLPNCDNEIDPKADDYNSHNISKDKREHDKTELRGEIKMSFSVAVQTRTPSPSSSSDNEKNAEENKSHSEEPPTNTEKQKNVGEEEKFKKTLPKNKASKIPVSISRLKARKDSKSSRQNENFQPDKFYEHPLLNELSLKDDENAANEFIFQHIPEKNDDITIQVLNDTSYKHPIYEYLYQDTQKNTYTKLPNIEESKSEISFIDNWISRMLDASDNGRNACEIRASSFKNTSKTSLCKENVSLCSLQLGNVPRFPYSVTESEIPKKLKDYGPTYVFKTNGSFESFYDVLGETDDEKYEGKLDGADNWFNVNFEEGSTITVPSDKELELAHHRDPNFRNLPDYPNTPYNLRHLRYKQKVNNSAENSPEFKNVDNSNRIKALKHRKKSYSATPKRIKSSRRRRKKSYF